MEKQIKRTNKKNDCTYCSGNGFIKTGSDINPYTQCYKCKGKPVEDVE